ncbi:MAG: hypothetical protein P8M22_00900, partial [Phycisphaerales bacterium]|nr:hypothetical protein [Phycisphaerales bacterium]
MKRMSAIVAGLSLAFVGTSSAWATEGACCIVVFSSTGDQPYNTCEQHCEPECLDLGGVFMGEGVSCADFGTVDGICRQINV